MADKRKDSRGRNLKDGEDQMPDGRYRYRYADLHGNRKAVYTLQPFFERMARRRKKKSVWAERLQEERPLLSTGNLAERLAALRNSLLDSGS